MGDRILTIFVYALLLAGLGDALAHPEGTKQFFSGLGDLAGGAERAAAGAYSTR